MKNNNHTHKYQKIKLGSGRQVFKCMFPSCSHYMPEIELTLGRASICWGCGKEIIMTIEQMARTKPICDECKEERIKRLEREKLLPALGDKE